MAPKRASHRTVRPTVRHDSADSEPRSPAHPQSQSQDMEINLQEIVRKRKQTVEEHKKKTQQTIETRFKARIAVIRADVDNCHQEFEEEIRETRRTKIDRLAELLQKRNSLQVELDKCVVYLENTHKNTARQLEVALGGRSRDLL